MRLQNRILDDQHEESASPWASDSESCFSQMTLQLLGNQKLIFQDAEGSEAVDLDNRRPLTPIEAAEQIRERYRISRLEREVEQLRNEVVELRNAVCKRHEEQSNGTSPTDPCLLDLVRVTEEIFPGSILIETERDPSDDDSSMVMISVNATSLEIDEIINRQLKWHELVRSMPSGYSGQLRLNVMPD